MRDQSVDETTDQPRIGIKDVDDEHRLQFQLLAMLEESLRAGDGEQAKALARQLYDFSDAHFGSEQVLMRLHSFPGYEAHEREHGELLAEFRHLLDQVSTDPSQLAETPRQLRQWLILHIQTSDRAFGNFALRSGIATE